MAFSSEFTHGHLASWKEQVFVKVIEKHIYVPIFKNTILFLKRRSSVLPVCLYTAFKISVNFSGYYKHA